MSEYMNQELLLFAKSIWMGAIIISAYDLLRICRKVWKHGFVGVAIEDLFYWCSCGVFLFSKMYRENNGIIRAYVLGGILLGGLCYHYSISDKIVNYSTAILVKMKEILKIPLKYAISCIKRLNFCLVRGKLSLYHKLALYQVGKNKNEKADKEKKSDKKRKSKRIT